MNSVADKIVRDLLQKDSLEQVKQAQLEDLVKDYPYFSLARYLLAAKAAGTGSPNADRIISASALYFNNPLWFSQILNMNGSTVEPAESSANDTENYPAQEITTDPSAVQAEPVLNSTGEIPADEPEPVTSGEIGDFTDDTTGIVEANVPDPAIRSALEAVKTEASRETSETDLIQPYHAIDYFASQGIKLAQDKEPQDKFGKQLKSFTEWLKTMKKIPVPNPEDFDDAANQNIQNIAAHSVEGGEIITEAMAEVLIKQNKPEKAIEVYRKLSLQNPAKSRYFATKIDQLANKI